MADGTSNANAKPTEEISSTPLSAAPPVIDRRLAPSLGIQEAPPSAVLTQGIVVPEPRLRPTQLPSTAPPPLPDTPLLPAPAVEEPAPAVEEPAPEAPPAPEPAVLVEPPLPAALPSEPPAEAPEAPVGASPPAPPQAIVKLRANKRVELRRERAFITMMI